MGPPAVSTENAALEPTEKGVTDQIAILKKNVNTIIARATTGQEIYDADQENIDSLFATTEAMVASLTDVQLERKFSLPLVSLRARLDTALDLRNCFAKQSPSPHTSSLGNSVRLPRLSIPTFNGELKHYRAFRDRYDVLVHNNTALSVTDKIDYLVEALQGPAKQTLDGMSLEISNYENIMRALDDTYGDPENLANEYYKELAALRLATDGRGQRENLERIRKILNNLTSLNVEVNQDFLKTRILNKFPSGTVIKVLERLELLDLMAKVTKDSNVNRVLNASFVNTTEDDLASEGNFPGANNVLTTLDALSSVIRIQEKAEAYQLSGEGSSNNNRTPLAAGLVAAGSGSAPSAASNSSKCVFCGFNNHRSSDCRRYQTLNDRREVLNNLRVCHICLQGGHETSRCTKRQHRCALCREPNHMAHMCIRHLKRLFPNPRSRNQAQRTGTFIESFVCMVNNTRVEVRGVVDSGSQYSFIDQLLAKRLGAPITDAARLSIGIFGSSETTFIESGAIRLTVENINSPSMKRTFNFRTTPCITGAIVTAPSSQTVSEVLPRGLSYADPDIFAKDRRPIQMIIGNNHQFDLYTGRIRKLKFGITLRESYLGWIPTGELRDSPSSSVCTRTPILLSAPSSKVLGDDQLEKNLGNLWSLESLGIKISETQNTDDLVLEKFRQTFRFENNRYVVCWPWKMERPELTSNFRMCVARLNNLFERTDKDLLDQYDRLLKEQLSQSIIEQAPFDTPYLVHYLPHRAVIQKDKLRVVYDASAKTKSGKSLNDLLHRGPLLLESLVGLLLNFRLHKIAISADIEKAFLQIVLNEVDRDVVRFLWVKNINKPPTKDNLIVYRFARVPFGVISSPFLLHIVLQELLTSEPINTWNLLAKDHFYVDNLVVSLQDLASAIDLFHSTIDRMKSASFNLRDWTSNDADFLKACGLPPPPDDPHNLFSILGMNWSRKQDILTIKTAPFDPSAIITKRKVLQFYASIFDPMGLFSPSILQLKLLLQDCWRNKFLWDEPLPPTFAARFIKLAKECIEISNFKVPRRFWEHSTNDCSFTLHVFCDASKVAYACCAYLTLVNKKSYIRSSSLIYSKVRAAPSSKTNKKDAEKSEPVEDTKSDEEGKDLTTPKLELMAAAIGNRTLLFLASKLKVQLDKRVLWTDATTILQWLSTPSVLPTFIANRIGEIRKTPNLIARYVPTSQNPADIASRGMPLSSLEENDLWWKGPSWLTHETMWQGMPENTTVHRSSAVVLIAGIAEYSGILSNELEEKFSSWDNYIRFFRFWHRLRCRCNSLPFPNSDDEYRNAEEVLIKELQRKYFPGELQRAIAKKKLLEEEKLREEKKDTKEPKKKKPEKPYQSNPNLDLFIDDNGIIRCKGRLQNSPLPWETIHPIYLPRDSPIVEKYLHDLHSKNHHIGASHLLSKLRERFWIAKGRAKANSIVHKCTICRRWEGGPYKLPPMPPLPLQRVTEAAPFLMTGLDYLGPVSILVNNISTPMYVALFVCLVTRAVHLEYARNLSAGEFLLTFDRFCSKRGPPCFILSDNATNFTFVQPLVSKKVDPDSNNIIFSTETDFKSNAVKKYLESKDVHWKFIPPLAPWHGGAYERLVSLVKRSLKKSFGFKYLDQTQFTTALDSIMDTINDRPLTYVSSNENLKPLTPNDFLRPGRTNRQRLTLNENRLNPNSEQLIRVHKDVTAVLEVFWDIFRSEYLTSLREKHTSIHRCKKGSSPFMPNVGDIVLLKDNAPRAEWLAGVIERLDKRQSVAHVRSKGKVYLRSIRLLCPLEITTPPLKPEDINKAKRNYPPPTYLNKKPRKS